MRKSLPLAILAVLVFASTIVCQAADIYISQNTSGGDTGANCSNAHSASWFNSNATGGNIYHLCATFTGAAGSTMLTVPSGTSGNTLTVLFEPGAVLTAPYWGGQNAGAINILGKSYIKIDGGSNGVIQNTANGDALANQQMSQGIYLQAGSSNIEITNLTIQNIYKSVANGTGNNNATNTADVAMGSGGVSSISVHDSTLNNAGQGIQLNWDGGTTSNISFYNNIITDHRFGIQIGSWVASGSTSNINIYGNKITDWSNWATTNDFYHTDGIIVWGDAGHPTNVNIYNNDIYGAFFGTGEIYCTWDGISTTGIASVCNIFNNVLINTQTANAGKAIWTGSYTGPHNILNNTIAGPSSNSGNNLISVDGTVGSFKNNIFYSTSQAVGSYATSCCSNISASDYNLFYAVSGDPFAYNIGTAGQFITYSQWQGLGFDVHGITGNPNLSTTYGLQSGSAAIGKGANLTSLGITALNTDAAGVARPSTGAWDIGAFQFSTQTGGVNPPTGLTAIVN